MASYGVKFESERKERKLREELVQEQIVVKNMAVTVSDDTKSSDTATATRPVAYIRDIPSFVRYTLNRFDEKGLLTWHNRQIHHDEIWIKVGADHGGNSLKMTLQTANLERPNSKSNTFLCCLFEGKDTHENLATILGEYSQQLNELRQMEWHGKKVETFVFGDYDFLCKMYRISGAAGVHPCIWCTVSKANMQKSPDKQLQVARRTLKSLRKDHRQFLRHGKGKKGNAKKFNNVMTGAVWRISINHVCPPYLHILLGIVKRHHDMLEKECHSIDLQIADVLAKRREKVAESTKFGSFIISKQNAKQLVKKKARKEHKLATLPQGSEEQLKTKKELAVIEKKNVKVAKTKASFSIRTCHIKPGQSLTKT